MKRIVLNSRNEALKLGLIANWEFTKDKLMSPKGYDIMLIDTPEWRAKTPLDYNKQPCELSILLGDNVIVYFGTKQEVDEYNAIR